VTARGNARAVIYLNDGDRATFRALVGQTLDRFGWLCHAYCLMTNHYHLLVGTPRANLSRGMRHLNGVYTQSFNRGHGRVGHVFQGRYKAILVERETHLLELCRYVVLNPVRAGLAAGAADWSWSSYQLDPGSRPGRQRAGGHAVAHMLNPWAASTIKKASCLAGPRAEQKKGQLSI
jgi:REP element-mobilizing transposase RayT